MYIVRTQGYSKKNSEQRWALPERVFFACGACHILAYAFLERYQVPNAKAIWIKPRPGFWGNHIFVAVEDWTFDYHGYSRSDALLEHTWKRAQHFWPRWDATLVQLPAEVLISEPESRTYDGLWLREPKQFLHDAMPRAQAYLDRLPPPPLSS